MAQRIELILMTALNLSLEIRVELSMPTTGQVARQANVDPQTIRNYAETYSELLSRRNRQPGAPRLFTDEDAEILCTIAALRRSGVPSGEIVARIRNQDDVPPLIDVPPQNASNDALNPQNTGQDAFYALQLIQPTLNVRFDMVERHMEVYMNELRDEFRQQRKYHVLWGMLMGAIVALVGAAFVLFVIWLTVNGAPWEVSALQSVADSV